MVVCALSLLTPNQRDRDLICEMLTSSSRSSSMVTRESAKAMLLHTRENRDTVEKLLDGCFRNNEYIHRD